MPFIQEAAKMINEARGWMFLVATAVVGLFMVGDVISYIRGKGPEKKEALDNIIDKIWIVPFAYFVVWLISYATGRFAKVKPTAMTEFINHTKLAIDYIKTIASV